MINCLQYVSRYRYTFQGQESDDEVKGAGNSINYTFRMHDARVGRFFTLDPLASKYSFNSPYAFSQNRVIDGVELEGAEYYRPAILTTEYWNSWWANIGKYETEDALKNMHHVALDILGVVPVIGELADGTNALIYAFEGDYVNAAISAAAMIPIVGEAGKVAKYAVKYGDEITGVISSTTRKFTTQAGAEKFIGAVAKYGEKAANALWDSYKLKGAMKGVLKEGEHAHHLIPVNLVKTNNVVRDALEAGYDINAKGNGIGLSPVKNGGVHAKHPNYTKQVEAKINKWASENEGYTPGQAKQFLEGLQKSLNKQVETGSKVGGTKVNELKLN